MIARTWRGSTTPDKAQAYNDHFTDRVAPRLKEIAGHRGAWLLRRETEGRVEFLAVTLWDSLETIRAFAGEDPEVARVEPQARAVLDEFDPFVRHYEVAYAA